MAGLAPCERVFHARVCALQITHISILAARQRQCHGASVCSTRGCVTFSAHTSPFSRHVKGRATKAGLAPCERVFHARVCDLRRTHLSVLAARQRPRHDGMACPCERVSPAQVCARQRLYTFTLLARLKTALRRQGLPLRACVPRSGVCTSASTHEGGKVECRCPVHVSLTVSQSGRYTSAVPRKLGCYACAVPAAE